MDPPFIKGKADLHRSVFVYVVPNRASGVSSLLLLGPRHENEGGAFPPQTDAALGCPHGRARGAAGRYSSGPHAEAAELLLQNLRYFLDLYAYLESRLGELRDRLRYI